jgi:hypothetical protein
MEHDIDIVHAYADTLHYASLPAPDPTYVFRPCIQIFRFDNCPGVILYTGRN